MSVMSARLHGQVEENGVGGFPHGRVPAAVRSEQLLDVAEEAIQLHLGTERGFAELFARLAPQQDPQALLAFAHSIGGAAHQLAQWWLRTPQIPREQIVRWYSAVCWEGLRSSLGVAESARGARS